MNTLIEATDITVIRNRQTILQDISLTIGEHDFVTLIGPNGAGKSMLLKCLLGFYKPDKGQVKRRRHLRAAYVPQHLNANNTMPISVRRFLLLRQRIDHRELQKITDETDTSALLDKPLQVLSGGEMQRVLMARALINEPQLLVLDEPAQNLDVAGQLAFYKLVDQVYQQRTLSVLMVSHDLHMVMASTRQVLCLFHHICCSGTPQSVARDPEFISLFGKDMATMMAMYRHDHDHTHLHDSLGHLGEPCGHDHGNTPC